MRKRPLIFLAYLLPLISACSLPYLGEDSSASGAVASAVGYALGASSATGTIVRNTPSRIRTLWERLSPISLAYAFNDFCPLVTTANGSGCTTNGSAAVLGLNNCLFLIDSATWTGNLQLSLGTGSVACGTFPAVVGTNLYRQFVTASGVAGTGSRLSALGTTVTVDHATSNIDNFDGVSIPTLVNSGYGLAVAFNGSGNRTAVTVLENLSAVSGTGVSTWNYTLNANVSVSETNGARTVTGQATVYDNVSKVTGTATFQNVLYNDTCCYPLGGSVSVSYAAGNSVTPSSSGASKVGKTETLQFSTTCGNATLTETTGTRYSTALANCV